MYFTLVVFFCKQIRTLLKVLLELALFNTSKYINQFEKRKYEEVLTWV